MEPSALEAVVRNIDERLGRVEQILPTLATKTELGAAIAPLATKAELAETKSELRTEIREEGARTRRHFDVVAERLEGHIRLLAEGQSALREHVDQRLDQVSTELAQLDRRVMRLELTRRP